MQNQNYLAIIIISQETFKCKKKSHTKNICKKNIESVLIWQIRQVKLKRQANSKPTRAARNVIAERDDGIILFLVTDGASYSGITFNEGIDVLEKYGATTAANLDGGASTQLVVNKELLNSPKNALGIPIPKGRTVVNGWGVFLDN